MIELLRRPARGRSSTVPCAGGVGVQASVVRSCWCSPASASSADAVDSPQVRLATRRASSVRSSCRRCSYGAGVQLLAARLREQARADRLLAIGWSPQRPPRARRPCTLVVPRLRLAPRRSSLGAILAPTDPVVAVSVLSAARAAAAAALIEGESLVNDGVGLVLLQLAVGAPRAARSPSCGAGQLVGDRRPAAWRSALGDRRGHRRLRRRHATTRRSRSRCRCSCPTRRTIAREASTCRRSSPRDGRPVLGARSTSCSRPSPRTRRRRSGTRSIFLLESALFLLHGLQSARVDGDRGRLTRAAWCSTVAVVAVRRHRPADHLDVHGQPAPAR